MVGYALDDLANKGKVIADSQVDLVKSPIGVAVKSGTPKPDISTPDALKRALQAVKTVAYSDSASGVYVSTEMFGKLGIADEMKDKARKIPATPVGEIVAHGNAEIGFQQMSELKPVEGIDIVGPLPDELQKITVFSAGIASVSKEPEAGKALIKFLASPAARAEIVKSGMDPIAASGRTSHRQASTGCCAAHCTCAVGALLNRSPTRERLSPAIAAALRGDTHASPGCTASGA